MGRGLRRRSPALFVSLIALFAALGGGVYAAGKAKRINGRAIRAKSIPGNRLKPRSVPGNRLKPGAIPGASLKPGSIGGLEIDEGSLGQVPSAVHATSADSATDAETALNAVNAVNATTVNGHEVGCAVDTRPFAGACWQTSAGPAATAPEAAAACAAQGGALPEALQLAAFAIEPDVTLDAGGEWTSEIVSFTSENVYSVATVSATGSIGSGLFNNGAGGTVIEAYRCVFPLVS